MEYQRNAPFRRFTTPRILPKGRMVTRFDQNCWKHSKFVDVQASMRVCSPHTSGFSQPISLARGHSAMFDLPVKSWLAQVERRALEGLLAAFCLSAFSMAAPADSTTTSQSSALAAPVSHWAEQVLLGSSSLELTGPWNFHRGDKMDW